MEIKDPGAMEGSPLAAFTTPWAPVTGEGNRTFNARVLEMPPGTVTAIPTLPWAAIRAAGTLAVNCVSLTNVVGSGPPFHWTTAPARNPLPPTASVKPGPPRMTEPGLREVIAGG
jgi:hypothetical protein